MVGSIIRADNSGLGILAWEFHRHGIIDKVAIVPNPKKDYYPERFKWSVMHGSNNWFNEFSKDLKLLLVFETPFDYWTIPECKKLGIKSIYMPMHECFNSAYFKEENKDFFPDLWVMPSSLEMAFPLSPKIGINIPVATDRIKWRQRNKALNFIHNGGWGGLDGRNGTDVLLDAMKHVKSSIKLTIRVQQYDYKINDNRVEIEKKDFKNYWDLWKDGDVFVFPEKWNGLSLPLQEAFASGMGIITTKKEAFNWLPQKWLIEPEKIRKKQIANSPKFDEAIHSPIRLAEMIDKMYDQDIKQESLAGKRWAEKNSWEQSKFKKLCDIVLSEEQDLSALTL